ncbi:PCI domain-containing protein 2-like [Watersipora subatra]|uniref:PCI domain-containing protein 2-like n=1 Tax=Watersipora subatra TaxID=2589382 RepID=UPI00355B164F
MAHSTLEAYLEQIAEALEERDALLIAPLLSFKHPHIKNVRLRVRSPEQYCERILQQPWDEIVAAHIRALWAVSNSDYTETYACQSAAISAFTKAFQAMKDENWALPIMFVLSIDLRLFAISADNQRAHKFHGSKKGEMLEKAADLLMGCFRVCASDNRSTPENSKKWGMLNLVNQLFKIYFRINKLHLCKPLTRAIDSLPIKDKFSLSQLVTYRYYVGRKCMFENDFKAADEYLTFAFEHCHRSSRANRRLILISLLPVKMLMGRLPQKEALQRHDLMQFASVADAVKCGNLLKLTQALQKNEPFFIKSGVYLILEKLKIITYRNLFKKVWLLMKTHQLPVSSFVAALQLMKYEGIDLDEAECIIANLIYEGKVKGYISHAHRTVVVSKQEPFPALTEVL